jgi:hypothetical protein
MKDDSDRDAEFLAPRPYQPPFIEELGTVAELAQGGAPSTNSDSGSNNMRPP